MGIVIPDLDRPIGDLSGGQKQCIAIARAIYFGAKVVILDEPTAALGVKQSGVVLKYIAKMRDAGLGSCSSRTTRTTRTWSVTTSSCSTAAGRSSTAPTTRSPWNTSPRKWPAATNWRR